MNIYLLTQMSFISLQLFIVHCFDRLEFRRLVRKYGADLCFTPMTMTDSFCQSEKARQIEFSTSTGLT